MAHDPGAGLGPVYAAGIAADSLPRGPRTPPDAARKRLASHRRPAQARPGAFSRALRQGPRARPSRWFAAGIFAAPGVLRPPPRYLCHLRPARGCLSLSAHLEPTVAWRELRAELRRAVGESTYEIWLASLELKSVRDGTLTLDAPAATYDWVSKRFARIISSCARIAFGPDIKLELACHGVDRARQDAQGRAGRRPRPRRRRAQPALQLRPVHHRRRQSPRPRRLAGGRRAPRPGLQPAVPARPAGPREDPPPPGDRQLRRCRSATAPPSATRRPRRSPTTSSGHSVRGPSIASSRPTATPTCC